MVGAAEAAPAVGPAGRCTVPAILPSLGRGCGARNRRGVPMAGMPTRRTTLLLEEAQVGSCRTSASRPWRPGHRLFTRTLSPSPSWPLVGIAEAAPAVGPAGRCTVPASLPSLGRGCGARNRRGVPTVGMLTRWTMISMQPRPPATAAVLPQPLASAGPSVSRQAPTNAAPRAPAWTSPAGAGPAAASTAPPLATPARTARLGPPPQPSRAAPAARTIGQQRTRGCPLQPHPRLA